MNKSGPLLIEETNLSHAWASAFMHVIDNAGKEISSLLITLTGFTNGLPAEEAVLRDALALCLFSKKKQKVNTVANTIFPSSLWKRSKYDRKRLFEMYLKALPRYKTRERLKNRRGIYFERLIAFGSGPENDNQLEYIISQYKSNPNYRRSMFQASIFDPERDRVSSAQLPFPCFQHVSFVPQNKEKTLTLNAFYATQQIFEKAYGNWTVQSSGQTSGKADTCLEKNIPRLVAGNGAYWLKIRLPVNLYYAPLPSNRTNPEQFTSSF